MTQQFDAFGTVLIFIAARLVRNLHRKFFFS